MGFVNLGSRVRIPSEALAKMEEHRHHVIRTIRKYNISLGMAFGGLIIVVIGSLFSVMGDLFVGGILIQLGFLLSIFGVFLTGKHIKKKRKK